MTSSEIDQLVGDNLNRAVLLSLGAELICGSHSVYWILNGSRIPDKRYAWNIADAWELDGEGWLFEMHDTAGPKGNVWGVSAAFCTLDGVTLGSSWVLFSDFPTKAAAYATARCRAWLKAKIAEADKGGNDANRS